VSGYFKIRRVAILGVPFRTIEAMTGVAKSSANNIFRHAVKNATEKRATGDLELNATSSRGCAASSDSTGCSGLSGSSGCSTSPGGCSTYSGSSGSSAPPLELAALGQERLRNAQERACDAKRWEKKWEQKKGKGCTTHSDPDKFLVRIEDDLQLLNLCEAEPSGAAQPKPSAAAQREPSAAVLPTPSDTAVKPKPCVKRNCGFTDEMAIEVGGIIGVCLVWREQGEQWHDDCVGAKKKQGPSAMCWGFIM
jgi:hypothetical protein